MTDQDPTLFPKYTPISLFFSVLLDATCPEINFSNHHLSPALDRRNREMTSMPRVSSARSICFLMTWSLQELGLFYTGLQMRTLRSRIMLLLLSRYQYNSILCRKIFTTDRFLENNHETRKRTYLYKNITTFLLPKSLGKSRCWNLGSNNKKNVNDEI